MEYLNVEYRQYIFKWKKKLNSHPRKRKNDFIHIYFPFQVICNHKYSTRWAKPMTKDTQIMLLCQKMEKCKQIIWLTKIYLAEPCGILISAEHANQTKSPQFAMEISDKDPYDPYQQRKVEHPTT